MNPDLYRLWTRSDFKKTPVNQHQQKHTKNTSKIHKANPKKYCKVQIKSRKRLNLVLRVFEKKEVNLHAS